MTADTERPDPNSKPTPSDAKSWSSDPLAQLAALAERAVDVHPTFGSVLGTRVLALVAQAQQQAQHKAADHLSAYGQLLERVAELTTERDRLRAELDQRGEVVGWVVARRPDEGDPFVCAKDTYRTPEEAESAALRRAEITTLRYFVAEVREVRR